VTTQALFLLVSCIKSMFLAYHRYTASMWFILYIYHILAYGRVERSLTNKIARQKKEFCNLGKALGQHSARASPKARLADSHPLYLREDLGRIVS